LQLLGKRRSKRKADRAALRDALAGDAAEHVPDVPESPPDPVYAGDSLGAALRTEREKRKLSLEALAETTRVRRSYLEALEAGNLEALPSRPFTVGYIRAYATALGLNPDLAVERFKTDEPVLDEELRAPVGVFDEKDPRVAAFLIGALVIIAAIVLWNVAQRSMMAGAPPPPLAGAGVVEKALRSVKPRPVELGSPLPAPVESTTPPPYETPGLAEAMGLKTDDASRPKPANEAPSVDLAHLPQTFTPLGKVYDAGVPGVGSVVTLQALKPAALILRGADGSVYFARQLSKGEAFRVPNLGGLTIDVSQPSDVQVFAYGQSKGVLPAALVLASKLVTAPPAPKVAPGTAAAPPAKPAAPAAAPDAKTP
jgi:transcriptional regulator with XRE-family HTH domain